MDKFETFTGVVCAVDRANIDTDALIPQEHLKSIKRTGFEKALFFDWRYHEDGKPNPEFELWYSRSELRDEKVVLFADYLPKGTYEYSYTMRATLPGDYHVIPTVASQFYFPEVFGRSDGRLLSIGR